MKIKKEECECKSKGGLFIPAGLFVGIGTGFLLGSLVAYTLIGLGLGFLVFAIIALFCNCGCGCEVKNKK